MSKPLLEVTDLQMHFPVCSGVFKRQTGAVYAVDGVDLTIESGETLGLVGESGCGKSTLGKCIMRLYNPTGGSIKYDGQELVGAKRKQLLPLRELMQIIFQDPQESLNARHTVGGILEEPLEIHKVGKNRLERKEIVLELLEKVGLPESAYERYPHEFSGGQRQRIGIARAIALEPDLIICDEAVSALDVSIQSQILNLLMDLQEEMGIAYLFIAHDLSVVRHISDRVAVMYLGRIVEIGDADEVYFNPQHPYTKALISAIPQVNPSLRREKIRLKGEVPSPMNPPSGCAFHTRCPYSKPKCKKSEPFLEAYEGLDEGHQVACHLVEDLLEEVD